MGGAGTEEGKVGAMALIAVPVFTFGSYVFPLSALTQRLQYSKLVFERDRTTNPVPCTEWNGRPVYGVDITWSDYRVLEMRDAESVKAYVDFLREVTVNGTEVAEEVFAALPTNGKEQ